MLRAARPKPSAGCGLFLPLQSPGVWVTITPVLRMRRVRLGKVGERAHSHPAGLGWWTCHPEPIENGTRPKNVFRGAGTRRSCLRRASPCPSRPPTPSSRGEASSRQAHTHCGKVRERERERPGTRWEARGGTRCLRPQASSRARGKQLPAGAHTRGLGRPGCCFGAGQGGSFRPEDSVGGWGLGPELYQATFSLWRGPSDTPSPQTPLGGGGPAVRPASGRRLSGPGVPSYSHEGVGLLAASWPRVHLTACFRFTQRWAASRGPRGGGPGPWLPSKGSAGEP